MICDLRRLFHKRVVQHLVHMGDRHEFHVILHALWNFFQIPLVIFGEQDFCSRRGERQATSL